MHHSIQEAHPEAADLLVAEGLGAEEARDEPAIGPQPLAKTLGPPLQRSGHRRAAIQPMKQGAKSNRPQEASRLPKRTQDSNAANVAAQHSAPEWENWETEKASRARKGQKIYQVCSNTTQNGFTSCFLKATWCVYPAKWMQMPTAEGTTDTSRFPVMLQCCILPSLLYRSKAQLADFPWLFCHHKAESSDLTLCCGLRMLQAKRISYAGSGFAEPQCAGLLC